MKRVEDPHLLTGRGQYVDDLPIPNLHHAAIVRSPHAHARIRGYDLAAALGMPGVTAALTGADVVERTRPFSVGVEAPVRYYCAATDRARFVGEPVAVVIARDRYLAEDAAERLVVRYEPLPAVVDPERALDADAPVLHDAVGSNLACHRRLVYGDPDRAFTEADVVLAERFRYPKYSSTPIETYGVIARWDPFEQVLTVWSNFMGPFAMHTLVARALGLAENRLRFVVAGDIGGSFGIKSSLYPYIALVGLAAMRAGGARDVDRDPSGTPARVLERHRPDRVPGAGGPARWHDPRHALPLVRQRRRLHPEPGAGLHLPAGRQLRRSLSLPAPRGRRRHRDDEQGADRSEPWLRLRPPLLRDGADAGPPRREAPARPRRGPPPEPDPGRRVSVPDADGRALRQRRLRGGARPRPGRRAVRGAPPRAGPRPRRGALPRRRYRARGRPLGLQHGLRGDRARPAAPGQAGVPAEVGGDRGLHGDDRPLRTRGRDPGHGAPGAGTPDRGRADPGR